MKFDYFIISAAIYVVLIAIGLFVGFKNKTASIEPSYVLPLLGWGFATSIGLGFIMGFVEYVVGTYTHRDSTLFGFSDTILRVPAAFGSIVATYLTVYEFYRFLRRKPDAPRARKPKPK